MSDPELFKYDIRIRRRMLEAGLLSEKEVQARLEQTPEAAHKAEILVVKQPAMGRHDEGTRQRTPAPAEAAPVAAAAGPVSLASRAAAPPVSPAAAKPPAGEQPAASAAASPPAAPQPDSAPGPSSAASQTDDLDDWDTAEAGGVLDSALGEREVPAPAAPATEPAASETDVQSAAPAEPRGDPDGPSGAPDTSEGTEP